MSDNLNNIENINEDDTAQYVSQYHNRFRLGNKGFISTGQTKVSEDNFAQFLDPSLRQIYSGTENLGSVKVFTSNQSGDIDIASPGVDSSKSDKEFKVSPYDLLKTKYDKLEKDFDSLKSKYDRLESEMFSKFNILKKEQNLQKLFNIKSDPLFGNHPEYSAIPEKVFSLAQQLILHADLKHQPELFPSGEGSIQFEFGKSPTDYLEIEIFDEKIEYYSEINSEESEGDLLNIEDTIRKINGI